MRDVSCSRLRHTDVSGHAEFTHGCCAPRPSRSTSPSGVDSRRRDSWAKRRARCDRHRSRAARGLEAGPRASGFAPGRPLATAMAHARSSSTATLDSGLRRERGRRRRTRAGVPDVVTGPGAAASEASRSDLPARSEARPARTRDTEDVATVGVAHAGTGAAHAARWAEEAVHAGRAGRRRGAPLLLAPQRHRVARLTTRTRVHRAAPGLTVGFARARAAPRQADAPAPAARVVGARGRQGVARTALLLLVRPQADEGPAAGRVVGTALWLRTAELRAHEGRGGLQPALRKARLARALKAEVGRAARVGPTRSDRQPGAGVRRAARRSTGCAAAAAATTGAGTSASLATARSAGSSAR